MASSNTDTEQLVVRPSAGEAHAINLLQWMEQWLVGQSEWPLILGMDRPARRAFGRSVAKLVTTIPAREAGQWNRAQVRAMVKTLRKEVKHGK